MDFIEGKKFVLKKKGAYFLDFKIGDIIIFKKTENTIGGWFKRLSDGMEQIVEYEDVEVLTEGINYDCDDYELEAVEYVEDTEFIAKVNFKGFGEPRTRYKTYHFKTTIKDLEKGEIVIVDSKGELQCANFLGYLSEGEERTNPTKYIISRFTTESVQGKKLDRYALENRGVKKISTQTKKLFKEIEEFHKQNYIDNCLENGNFEELQEFLQN